MDRARRLLPASLLVGYGVFCFATAAGATWRHDWDSATYLLTGQAIADGAGYAYQGRPFALRPPGFAWLLSLLAGETGYDLRLLNLLTAGAAALAVALVYVVLRPLHGRWIALGAALLAGTGAHFASTLNWVLSEFPFLVLFLTGVACLHRSLGIGDGDGAARERPWWVWSLAGGLALAAAAYVRTVAVLALPAILVLGLLRESGRRRARVLLPLALILLALLPWQLHAAGVNAAAEVPAEQSLLHTYSTALLHTDPGDPSSPRVDGAGWSRRLGSNGRLLLRDFAKAAFGLEGPPAQALLAILVLSGLGLALRRRPSLVEGYVLGNAFLLVVYFTYARRLALPLAPFVYLYVLLSAVAAGAWLGRVLDRPRTPALVGGLAFAVLFSVNLANLPRALDAESRPAGDLTNDQHWRNHEIAAAWVRENTPEEAVLLCNQAPVLEFLTGRRALTYRFPRHPGLLRRSAADYVVFDGPPAASFDLADVSRARVQRWALQGSTPASPILIVRVR